MDDRFRSVVRSVVVAQDRCSEGVVVEEFNDLILFEHVRLICAPPGTEFLTLNIGELERGCSGMMGCQSWRLKKFIVNRTTPPNILYRAYVKVGVDKKATAVSVCDLVRH